MGLFFFQCYPVCKFGNFISFGLGTVRSERIEKPETGDPSGKLKIMHFYYGFQVHLNMTSASCMCKLFRIL